MEKRFFIKNDFFLILVMSLFLLVFALQTKFGILNQNLKMVFQNSVYNLHKIKFKLGRFYNNFILYCEILKIYDSIYKNIL